MRTEQKPFNEKTTMKNQGYTAPRTETVSVAAEKMMIVVSPGVSDDYWEDMPIDAKQHKFYGYDDVQLRISDLWED